MNSCELEIVVSESGDRQPFISTESTASMNPRIEDRTLILAIHAEEGNVEVRLERGEWEAMKCFVDWKFKEQDEARRLKERFEDQMNGINRRGGAIGA